MKLGGSALRVLLAALSVLAGGVLGESLVRAMDPYGASYYRDTNLYLQRSIQLIPEAARPDGRLFENAPSRALVTRRATFATDAAGLRASSPEDPGPAPRSEATDVGMRILFLGDSVTLGWGVEHEQTWAALLERGAAATDGRRVETLNAGHLQYNTLQEVDWFLTHADRLEPDAVVLVPVVNDLDDAYSLYLTYMAELERRGLEGRSIAERGADMAHRHLPGFVGLLSFRDASRGAAKGEPDDALPIEQRPLYRERWPIVERALDRLLAESRARGMPLLVLDHTTPRLPGYQAWCEANGVPWFDFTFSAAEWARPIRNSSADSHANAEGNRLLFEKARAALVQAGWIAAGG